MTSIEIIEKLDELTNLIEKDSEALNLLKQLALEYPSITREINKASDSKTTKDQKPEPTIESSAVYNKLLGLRVGEVFVEIENLISELNKVNAKNSAFLNITNPITEKLEEFYELFELSVGRFNANKMIGLMRIAHPLNEILSRTAKITNSFKTMLSEEPKLEEGKESLSLFFTAPIEYNELIVKLIAIETLYNEIARLLNISTSEHPLEIARLEIGSWWIKIFGDSKVITLITTLCEKSVSYFHRTYTQEGIIQGISNKIEVIENLLGLSKILKEYGIDTKVLDENIGHSGVVLSRQLTKLLAGEPNVKINNKEHYIGKELDEKLLQERKTLLLETALKESSENSKTDGEEEKQ